MTKKLVLSLLIMLLFSSQSFTLTFKEAYLIAKKNNHSLKAASLELETYQLNLKRNYTNYLPQASLSSSYSNSGSSSLSLSVSQSLFDLDDYYSLKESQVEKDYYEINLKKSLSSLYYDVRLAFINLLMEEKNTLLLKEIYDRRQENLRLIDLRYQSGKEDLGSLLRTQADAKNAYYNLSASKRNTKIYRLTLSQIIDDEVLNLSEKIKIKEKNSLELKKLLASSPDYQMAKLTLQKAALERDGTLTGFLPTLSLKGTLAKSGSSWPPTIDNNSLTLSLSYNIFPGGSNFIDRAIYDNKYKTAQEEFKESVKELELSITETFLNLQDALESLKIKETYLNASLERAKIARTKYLNGLILYDEWDRIENEYISAEKNLLTAQTNALKKEALFYQSYGGIPDEEI